MARLSRTGKVRYLLSKKGITSATGAWTMTTLHVFTNGQVPTGDLVVKPDGAVYGTTAAAPGQPAGGTVFAITME
jgi:hypothetical protein